MLLLFLFAGILLTIVFIGSKTITNVLEKNDSQTEMIMGIVVVTAISALMTLLYILAVGFKFMKLADPKQALGLPDGSIRAMIALILIMVFVMFGIYLFRSVGYGFTVTLRGGIKPDSLKTVNLDQYKQFSGAISVEFDKKDSTYSIIRPKSSIGTIRAHLGISGR